MTSTTLGRRALTRALLLLTALAVVATTFTVAPAGAGDQRVEPDGAQASEELLVPCTADAVRYRACVDLDVGSPAVDLARSFDTGGGLASGSPAAVPSADLETGLTYVYGYQSVTEAGASERSQLASGLDGPEPLVGEESVDVTIAVTNAVVELTVLERDGAGAEVLAFDVVSGSTRSWTAAEATYEGFEPGEVARAEPATGVSISEHGDAPRLFVERSANGTVLQILRPAEADVVGLQFAESVLDSFHFETVDGQSSYSTTETSRAFADRAIASRVERLQSEDGVLLTRIETIPAKDLASGESRQRDSLIVIADDGVLAASRQIDRVEVAPAPDADGFFDNEGDLIHEGKAASIIDLRFIGSESASAAFIQAQRGAYESAGNLEIDTLDPATAGVQRAATRAIRQAELMDEALARFAQAPEESATAWMLAEAVAAHPDRADEVASLIETAPTHDGALVAVSALVIAGRDVPEAEAELASAMDNTAVPVGRRLTVAVNAVSLGNPGAQIVDAARRLATTDPSTANHSSSVLAWSALASQSTTKSDDDAVWAHLSATAGAIKNSEGAGAVVAALENLGTAAATQLALDTAKSWDVRTTIGKEQPAQQKSGDGEGPCGHRTPPTDSGYVPGLDWGCEFGERRIRGALDLRMGVSGTQGGPQGGANFEAEGKVSVRIYERDSNPHDDQDAPIKKEFDIAHAIVTSQLDTYDENNADDYVINVPGSQAVQVGQTERKFRFQVRTILNSNDQSSDDYWLVDREASVKCGLGAGFDLSLDENGDPRLATNWDPWSLPITAGPVIIELKLHLRGSITFPTKVSMDICNFGLFESDIYPADWEEGEPVDSGVVWATISASITPTLKLDMSASVTIEFLIVKVGVEAEGTIIGLDLPIAGSLQLLDRANGALNWDDPDFDLDNPTKLWSTPDLVVQPCYSISAHLYLLRLRFKAFGEFGFRSPFNGKWVTLYRHDWDLGRWEWEPNVDQWPFLQNLLDGKEIVGSDCGVVPPMVPTVTAIASGPPGFFGQPRVSGAPLEPNQPSANQFCIERGFPGSDAYADAEESTPKLANWTGSSWNLESLDDPGAIDILVDLQCETSTAGAPGTGQIGLCLSPDSDDWTLIYTGPYGGYISTSTDGGEFVAFTESGEAVPSGAERQLQLGWYRVCIDSGDQSVIKTSATAPVDTSTIFEHLTPWLTGDTAYETCTELQPVMNLYELIDCDRFDPTAFPDITIAVVIGDGNGGLPVDANSAPGPTVDGNPTLELGVTNTGLLDLTNVTITTDEPTPVTCSILALPADGSTQTCTGTLDSRVDMDGQPTAVAGTQSRSATITAEYVKAGETRLYSAAQAFFFTVASNGDVSYSIDVSLAGPAGLVDIGAGNFTAPVVAAGPHTLFPSITNTSQVPMTIDSVRIPGALYPDPGGCAGLVVDIGRTVSCDPVPVEVLANTDYGDSVIVSVDGQATIAQFNFSGVDGGPVGSVATGFEVQLSGTASQQNASTSASTPRMDPLLGADEDPHVIFVDIQNPANRTLYLDGGSFDFTTGLGVPATMGCAAEVEIPNMSGQFGVPIFGGSSSTCAAAVAPTAEALNVQGQFTAVLIDPGFPDVVIDETGYFRTGDPQLAISAVAEMNSGDFLEVTVVNTSDYPKNLDGIAVTMASPPLSGVHTLSCSRTALDTGESTACTTPITSAMGAATYTITAAVAGTSLATTTAPWIHDGAGGPGALDDILVIDWPAAGQFVDIGSPANQTGEWWNAKRTDGPTGTGSYTMTGRLKAGFENEDFEIRVNGSVDGDATAGLNITPAGAGEQWATWSVEVVPTSGGLSDLEIEIVSLVPADNPNAPAGWATVSRAVNIIAPGPTDMLIDSSVNDVTDAYSQGLITVVPPGPEDAGAKDGSDDDAWDYDCPVEPAQDGLEIQESLIESEDIDIGTVLVAQDAQACNMPGLLLRVVSLSSSQPGLVIAQVEHVSVEEAFRQVNVEIFDPTEFESGTDAETGQSIDYDPSVFDAHKNFSFDLGANAEATLDLNGSLSIQPSLQLDIGPWHNPEVNYAEISVEVELDAGFDARVSYNNTARKDLKFLKHRIPTAVGPIPVVFGVELGGAAEIDLSGTVYASGEYGLTTKGGVRYNGSSFQTIAETSRSTGSFRTGYFGEVMVQAGLTLEVEALIAGIAGPTATAEAGVRFSGSASADASVEVTPSTTQLPVEMLGEPVFEQESDWSVEPYFSGDVGFKVEISRFLKLLDGSVNLGDSPLGKFVEGRLQSGQAVVEATALRLKSTPSGPDRSSTNKSGSTDAEKSGGGPVQPLSHFGPKRARTEMATEDARMTAAFACAVQLTTTETIAVVAAHGADRHPCLSERVMYHGYGPKQTQLAAHVWDAINLGAAPGATARPKKLHAIERTDRRNGWYKSQPTECKQYHEESGSTRAPSGKACDEYPFWKTHEAYDKNRDYNSGEWILPSARYVSSRHNSSHGSAYRWIREECFKQGIPQQNSAQAELDKGRFWVVVIPDAAFSGSDDPHAFYTCHDRHTELTNAQLDQGGEDPT